jgi:Flp pilus assembly protein TadG
VAGSLRGEEGQAATIQTLFLLMLVLGGWFFVAFLGRLNSAGQSLENTAQSAARAASKEADPDAALAAAQEVVAVSYLDLDCESLPRAEMRWTPGPTGDWRGGAVTVVLNCMVRNQELAGIWLPGSRTLGASDTQVIDRFDQ